MPSVTLIYGTPVRRSQFFKKIGTRVVCRSGHERGDNGHLHCPSCGGKYRSEDVIQPTEFIERLMYRAEAASFGDWWDSARGDVMADDVDPGVALWQTDPVLHMEEALPRTEAEWDQLGFAVGVRLMEYQTGGLAPGIGARGIEIGELLTADARLRPYLMDWGIDPNAKCYLFTVAYIF